MNIAVDTKNLLKKKSKENLVFDLALISQLAAQKKGDQFFLITENHSVYSPPLPPDAELINPALAGKKNLLKKLWRQLQLPGILKKIKVAVLISFDVPASASLPQVLIVSEGKKINSETIKKASIVAVNSAWYKNELIKKNKTQGDKIEIVPLSVPETFKSFNEAEREKIKAKYSGGKEYFICTATRINGKTFICLLKSFSHFKKRQQSNMNLILLAKPGEKILKILSSYKYRNDVLINEKISDAEEAGLIASSYAVIISAEESQPLLSTLKALQCGVPLIASVVEPIKEIAGGTALYAAGESEKAIGEKMIQLYTDERLRNQLIKKGLIIAAGYTLQNTADHLWNCIAKAVK